MSNPTNIRVTHSPHGGLVFHHTNGTRLYWPEAGAPLYLLGLRVPVQVSAPIANPTEVRATVERTLAV